MNMRLETPMPCPCCAQPVAAPTLDIVIDRCGITRMQAHILRVIWRGRGHPVPTRLIFDAMYQDDPDGGPCQDTTYKRFKVNLHKLRARLQGSGIFIVHVDRTQGYRLVVGDNANGRIA